MFQAINNYKPEGWPYSVLLFISGITTWIFGDLTYGMIILILFTCMDFITGILKAGRNGGLESSKMPKVIVRLIGYPLLIMALHVFFFRYMPHIPGFEPDTNLFSETMVRLFNLIPHFVLAICILRELSSIVENLTVAGVISGSTALFLSKIFTRVRIHIEEKAAAIDKPEIINNNQGEPGL